MIYDQTGVTLVSDKDIAMRGTTITTPGHLDVQARNFESTVSKLVHTYHGDSFGMSATLCNQQFLATNTSTNFSSPFYNGDPTANQLNRLANSNGWIEGGLNSFATGINLVNTTNAALNGFRTGTLLQEALKHELPNFYAPSLGINFTWSSTDVYVESLGEGGFNVGSATFNVKDTVKFKGTPAQSLDDFIVNCQKFTVEGEQLRSKVDQKTTNINFTVSAKGDPYQVGVSTSHGQSATTAQVNGMMQVGGKLTVNADTMTLDGATVDAGQIAGAVKTLNVISRQDETHCDSSSLGVSTGGDFCISQQASDSRVLSEAAGIHVHDSINGTPDEFTVGTLNSVGGKIASDGVNNFTADRVNAKDLEDFQESSGFGINGNFKNFKDDTQKNHLMPTDKQSQAITTTNVVFEKTDYKAKNHTTISGDQGTNLDIKEKSGTIVTTAGESKEITENESHTFVLPIPTVTKGTAEQIHKNVEYAEEKIGEGWKKVTDFFSPPSSTGNKTPESYTDYRKGYTYDYSEKKTSHPHSGSKKIEDKDWGKVEKCSEEYPKDPVKDEEPRQAPKDKYVMDIGDAYARGRIDGMKWNDIPDYVNNLPVDLQFRYAEGRAEGQVIAVLGFALVGAEEIAVGVLVDVAVVGLRTFGIFKRTEKVIESVYHTVTNVDSAHGILEGIDPYYFRENTRFDRGLYVSDDPDVTMAELLYHNSIGEFTVKYEWDISSLKILDLTDKYIAELWNYDGNSEYELTKPVAALAQEKGYQAIKFPSQRAEGVNWVIFDKFDNLKPECIFPTPTKYGPNNSMR